MIETSNTSSQGQTLNLKEGLTFKIMLFLLGLFLLLRLLGLFLPYHQDEWKNVSASATVEGAGSFFAHPPLMQIMFVAAYQMFGINYFRIFPLLFALVSAILLYFVVRSRINKKAAVWSVALYSTSFYAIFGSLVPDVDGAILPFFFLLAVYLYDRWNMATALPLTGPQKWKWLILLISALLIGWLIKLSFVLAIGTLVVDYILGQRRNIAFRKVALFTVTLAGFGVAYAILIYLIRFAYPAFNIGIMFGHANQFTNNVGRNWIQIIVQGIKAIFYLSPLLLVPLLFVGKETFKKLRLFFVYLLLGLIFYFVLFDFSRGALDKYLMYLIVPLVAIVGEVISRTMVGVSARQIKFSLLIGGGLAVGLLSLNFSPHEVLSLYPKTEWFSRVFHGNWFMLNPFNGGSGPMGFYVSFLFIALSFIVSLVLGIISFFTKEWRKGIVIILITIGIIYNGVFVEELMFGKINGSAPEVLKETVAFIAKMDSIKRVFSYNDIGNRELSIIGKYEGRFYAAPDFEDGHKKKFTDFHGQYLIIDIPHLYENGFYGQFFARCKIIFETSSGKIAGRVYDC